MFLQNLTQAPVSKTTQIGRAEVERRQKERAAEMLSLATLGGDKQDNQGKQCLYNKAKATHTISDFGTVSGEAEYLNHLATIGPIAIDIQAGPVQHYKSGVMTSCPGSGIDHAVQLTGYGTDGGVEYWKIRNSWGASWGEHGFFRLVRGQNMCNMALFGGGYVIA